MARGGEMDREDVDAKTLREWLARGEEVTVVDVRRAEDHAEWSVPGSVNLDAYDRLKAGTLGRWRASTCRATVRW